MHVGRLTRLIVKKGDGLAISGFGGRVFRHRVVDSNEEMQYSCRNRGCFVVGFLVISCLLAVSLLASYSLPSGVVRKLKIAAMAYLVG